MDSATLVDLAPIARMALLGIALALGPLLWIWLRHRGAAPTKRLHALTLLTLFLTFDLVLFGAFTRLSDSGLGCPDWPGCYGSASPLGAQAQIDAAQSALPSGPVTHGKAWVEMVHRYLATAVGVLIVVMTAMAWSLRKQGAVAVAVVGHGHAGVGHRARRVRRADGDDEALPGHRHAAPARRHRPAGVAGGAGPGLRAASAALAACAVDRLPGSPRRWSSCRSRSAAGSARTTRCSPAASSRCCQGQWWPPMDFAQAFTVQRELGQTASGSYLPFAALTAIHMTHRLAAVIVLGAMLWLAWRLHATRDAALRRFAGGLAVLAALQLATGLSNVVLGWPIAAALLHTGGAAALAVVLATLLSRAQVRPRVLARRHEPGWPAPQNHVVS